MASNGSIETFSAGFVYTLPVEYVDAGIIKVRISAGMIINLADNLADISIGIVRSDEIGGVGSELILTSLQSCNSTTFANYDFAIDSSTLVAGDTLQGMITLRGRDDASPSNVYGAITSIKFMAEIKA